MQSVMVVVLALALGGCCFQFFDGKTCLRTTQPATATMEQIAER
jgi:hypothetical protein